MGNSSLLVGCIALFAVTAIHGGRAAQIGEFLASYGTVAIEPNHMGSYSVFIETERDGARCEIEIQYMQEYEEGDLRFRDIVSDCAVFILQGSDRKLSVRSISCQNYCDEGGSLDIGEAILQSTTQ